MKHFIFSIILVISVSTLADDVFRIEWGKNSNKYEKYSDGELRRRVWELERAVWQLQQKVFHLQGQKETSLDTWVCTVSPFTRSYSATGSSKAVAKMNVREKCSEGEGGDFHCKKIKCEK